jgi:TldD protein
MEKLAEIAVQAAQAAGASYADARWVRRREEWVSVKNGGLEEVLSRESRGLGVRVLHGGAWGFAASCARGEAAAAALGRQAAEIARASATALRRPVELAPVQPVVAQVPSWARIHPFQVPLRAKLDLLLACDAAMHLPGIVVRWSYVRSCYSEQYLVTSEGTRIWQERVVCGGGLQASAAEGSELQTRSYPAAHGGQTMARGWEVIEELALPDHARPTAQEALELLRADECPRGPMDIILEGSQLALQVHESCGHPIELDRVLGTEASFAGTSFLTLDKLGTFRYGSPVVNIVADATIAGALGSFAYDDEGVPAQRIPVVQEGIFCGYLTSRETAPLLGQTSNGAMRASGWDRQPLIRMTNINLQPGDAGRLEDLIRDTDEGLLLCTNRSWSIDDKRLNFQFACEVGYRIKGGQLAGLVRNPVYWGMTPQFWASCDAVCGPQEWRVWGVPNCGKGEPMQVMEVGHGVAPARFRQVQVASAR